MATRTQVTSSIFRFVAVAWMFVWIAVQAACVQHCSAQAFGASRTASAAGVHGCCAKKAAEKSSQPTAPNAPGSSCCSLSKALKAESIDPDQALTAALLFAVPTPQMPNLASTFVVVSPAHFQRCCARWDWVFLPEVSLGAALRGLAPPGVRPA